MKKLLVLALALAMCLSLAACGGSASTAAPASSAAAPASSEAAPASSEAPAEPGKQVFIQGFDLDYPPYSYRKDDGTVGGFDVEVAQAVCEYLGWEYQACPFNWDAKEAELASGACDCIWSGFTVEGREDDYLWSDAYSKNTQLILVPADSEIQSLADLAGKTVGVQTSTSAYDMLQDEEGQKALADTFGSLEVFETYTIAFNDLQAGGIDAIAIDATAGGFLVSGKEDQFRFLEETLGVETYAIGFRKDDAELRDAVNDAIKALSADGTIAKIAENEDYAEIREFLIV